MELIVRLLIVRLQPNIRGRGLTLARPYIAVFIAFLDE
jgi:hypothetical protein